MEILVNRLELPSDPQRLYETVVGRLEFDSGDAPLSARQCNSSAVSSTTASASRYSCHGIVSQPSIAIASISSISVSSPEPDV